jgi:hypothetical protein
MYLVGLVGLFYTLRYETITLCQHVKFTLNPTNPTKKWFSTGEKRLSRVQGIFRLKNQLLKK